MSVMRLIWLVVGDRHDPGDDRHGDARRARLLDEVEVELVVEEELGDQEAGAGLLLLARVAQVALAVGASGCTSGKQAAPTQKSKRSRISRISSTE